jgi:hypothetical protein
MALAIVRENERPGRSHSLSSLSSSSSRSENEVKSRSVLREGLGVALLETLMPCLHYYSTLAGLFAVLSGDGSSSIDILTVRGYKEAGGHWRSLMGSYWVMAPWLGEIVRGYSYEDIIVDFQSLRKRRLDF